MRNDASREKASERRRTRLLVLAVLIWAALALVAVLSAVGKLGR